VYLFLFTLYYSTPYLIHPHILLFMVVYLHFSIFLRFIRSFLFILDIYGFLMFNCVTADFFSDCIGCFGVYGGGHVAFQLLELHMH